MEYSVEDITKRIINRYPQLFHHVDIDTIRFEEYESEKGVAFAIYGLSKSGIALLEDTTSRERYILKTNTLKLEEFTPEQIQWSVLDLLLCINPACDGRVDKPEFVSHNVIVDAISNWQLGADFMNNANLPDLLGETLLPLF